MFSSAHQADWAKIRAFLATAEAGSLSGAARKLGTTQPTVGRQVAALASQVRTGVYIGRYTVVVDEDIDPTDLGDVVWAIATRADPERSIDIIRRSRSSSADPALSPDVKEKGRNPMDTFTSKAIIDACWPYEWKDRAYPVAQISEELRSTLLEKWGDKLFSD